jgi:phospholipid-binding lipoprotein MlaA
LTPLALALLTVGVPQQAEATPVPASAPQTRAAPDLADPLADPLTDPGVAAPGNVPVSGEAAKLPAPARALAGASVPALTAPHPRHAKGDPLEGINRRFFRLNAGLDRAIFRPAAMGYKHGVPRFARSGLRNFFSNLTEPIVFLNDLLQLKPGRAARTLVRFAVNSTIGFAGLADPAKLKPLHIVHHDNGFGSTLGRYGVGPGPYVYLPFAGPTTLRDLLGGQADRLVLPFTVQQPPFDRYEYQVPKAVVTGLDARAEADDELKALFAGAVDPYATLRSVFLQNRAGEILALRRRRVEARVPGGELDEALRDPAAPAAAPAAAQTAAPELNDPLADPAAAPPPVPAEPAPAAPARR